MKLVLIHGAPSTGKLTVARELALLTGSPLVDNHAAIDIARMIFGFAAPGFWDLVHDLRVTTLRGAAKANTVKVARISERPRVSPMSAGFGGRADLALAQISDPAP